MVCQSCVDKYVQYYMRKGLSRGQAERMALRLVQRVEKRRRREHWDARIYNVKMVLFKLALLTNWRATLLWSWKRRGFTWIGRHFNPDYTQNCTGTCVTTDCPNYTGDCGAENDCRVLDPPCSMGSCGCPAPLANSTQVSNSCTCQAVGYKCTSCSVITNLCTVRTYTCPCGGTCGYNCNTGYSWNGSQCVPSGRKTMIGDGMSCVVINA
jgi:hypothetical protein